MRVTLVRPTSPVPPKERSGKPNPAIPKQDELDVLSESKGIHSHVKYITCDYPSQSQKSASANSLPPINRSLDHQRSVHNQTTSPSQNHRKFSIILVNISNAFNASAPADPPAPVRRRSSALLKNGNLGVPPVNLAPN